MDFVLSTEVQSQLAGLNRRSSRTDIPVAENMTPMEDIKFVDYDFDWSTSHEQEFKDKLADVADNAILDACTGSNPRQPSQEEMEKLLKACYYDLDIDF